LFAQSGLSLDRLRALVEVGAAGSIARAAAGDVVKQSQYSRQIKELEDFFGATLIEREGRGIRFTNNGRELARISRFLLLGLSNFQRGCLGEEHTYRIGAGAAFIQTFLLPLLADSQRTEARLAYVVEALADDRIEQRLHELTLDFGVVTTSALTRPLKTKKLLSWNLRLFVPKISQPTAKKALREFYERRLPFVLATEAPRGIFDALSDYRPALICNNFLEARSALLDQGMACFLPDYLEPGSRARDFFVLAVSPRRKPKGHGPSTNAGQRSRSDLQRISYSLAWNPRLLRLSAQAERRRDFLLGCVSA